MKFAVVFLSKTLFVSVLLLFISACLDGEKKESNADELDRLNREKLELAAELQRLKELEQAQLKDAAEAKAKDLALKLEILEQEKAAELKLQKEAERLKELGIKRRQREQEYAFNKYKNTEYEELELLDGRILKSVKVVSVTAMKVSFMHRSGVAAISYSNLPEEIRELCKYDSELELIEMNRLMEAKERDRVVTQDRLKAAEFEREKRASGESSSVANSRSSNRNTQKVKPARKVTPRGNVTVRVVRSRRYSSHYTSRTYEIVASSNVDAYLSGSCGYHKVTAGQTLRTTFTYSARYEVKLIAKKEGVVLDRETHSRKSGLSGSGGL